LGQQEHALDAVPSLNAALDEPIAAKSNLDEQKFAGIADGVPQKLSVFGHGLIAAIY
jgi:hypothetical protein